METNRTEGYTYRLIASTRLGVSEPRGSMPRSPNSATTSSNDRPPCIENSSRAAAELSSLPKTATLHFMLNQDTLTTRNDGSNGIQKRHLRLADSHRRRSAIQKRSKLLYNKCAILRV
jgi:hypothetical protein